MNNWNSLIVVLLGVTVWVSINRQTKDKEILKYHFMFLNIYMVSTLLSIQRVLTPYTYFVFIFLSILYIISYTFSFYFDELSDTEEDN